MCIPSPFDITGEPIASIAGSGIGSEADVCNTAGCVGAHMAGAIGVAVGAYTAADGVSVLESLRL